MLCVYSITLLYEELLYLLLFFYLNIYLKLQIILCVCVWGGGQTLLAEPLGAV